MLLWRFTHDAAMYFHRILLKNVLRSPNGFFDQTPLGRIMHRFGHDVEVIDQVMPPVLLVFIHHFSLFAACIVVTVTATPYLLIVLAVLSIFFFLIQVHT